MENQLDLQSFNLVLDEKTAEKFAEILNEESLMHTGHTSHQSNSDMITPEGI